MFGTIRLAPGTLRWWIAPLAYVCSMIVLIGVSSFRLPPEVGQAAVFVGYIILATVIVLTFSKANAGYDLGVSKLQNGQNILFVTIAASAMIVLLSELAGVIDGDIARSTETLLTNIGFGTNGLNDFLIIVTICCLAPLGEEALYRGLIFRSIFNSLRTSFRSILGTWLASLIAASLAAFVFALSHGGEGQEATVIAFLFLSGLIYGLCYAVTGSLWAAILAHSINNSVALAFFAFPSDDISLRNKALILVAPVFSAALLWSWARVFPR